MKALKYIFLFSILIVLVSCEQPRTRRVSTTSSASSSSSSSTTLTEVSETTNASTEITTSSSTSPFSSSTFETNDEISHCQWSENGTGNFPYNHSIIGNFAICLSSSGNNKIYFQIQNPIYDSPICFFPTTNQDNATTYIGEAVCLNATSSTSIYPVQLYKNRSGYSNYEITGVMVMKDAYYYFQYPYYSSLLIPDAYVYCMNHMANTQYYYGEADTTYCEAFDAAKQYMYHQF